MGNEKCEIWQIYKKRSHFSSYAGWVGSYLVGWQMLWFLGPEFIPNHRKCLQGKKDPMISGWFVQYLTGL